MAVPSIRIYVGLPTKDDPTPAFVLQNLNDKKTLPPTFVRIERTPTGPGAITIVDAKPAYLERTELVHAIVGVVNLEAGAFLVAVKDCEFTGEPFGHKIFMVREVTLLPFQKRDTLALDAPPDERLQGQINAVQKFLQAGDFYFSPTFNMTRSLQSSAAIADNSLEEFEDWIDSFDDEFFWNRYLLRHFIRNQIKDYIVPFVKGHVGYGRCDVLDEPVDMLIVSRVGCKNAGTRYNARGVNDEGAAANFVETEFVIKVRDHTMSFVQTSGSVPLFWEQKFVKTSYQVSLTRSADATAPAFERHFERERRRTQMPQHIVCLLSPQSEKERMLLSAFQAQIDVHNAAHKDSKLEYEMFDVRAHCKNLEFTELQPFLRRMQSAISKCGYYWTQNKDVLSTQAMLMRSNCLDCLDRTHFVQTGFAWMFAQASMRSLGIGGKNESYFNTPLYQGVLKIWEENGTQLSTQYAGASSNKSKYTSKGSSIWGLVDAAVTGAERLYANTFLDGSRQEAIDAVLGKDEAAGRSNDDDAFETALKARLAEYSTSKTMRVLVGTWNVNGQAPTDEDVGAWLLPPGISPDMYVIGFQEIVDLTATNVMLTADQTNSLLWERHINDVITKRTAQKYVLLKTRQLVGVLLMVFVREGLVADVRQVGATLVKLGYGGMTANKGAVAIHCNLFDTSLCFVCAHLAAGQSNVEERNDNWRDATNGLVFSTRQQRRLDQHDVLIWLGDFNYRVDIAREDIEAAVAAGKNFAPILAGDQLLQQKAKGNTFVGLHEAPITFAPTYKYDVGTTTYDTSEKARAPAWTDRILYRALPNTATVAQLEYARAELYASDHRPVRGVFAIDVRCVDVAAKRKVATDVRRKLHPNSAGTRLSQIAAAVVGRESTSSSSSTAPSMTLTSSAATAISSGVAPSSSSSSSTATSTATTTTTTATTMATSSSSSSLIDLSAVAPAASTAPLSSAPPLLDLSFDNLQSAVPTSTPAAASSTTSAATPATTIGMSSFLASLSAVPTAAPTTTPSSSSSSSSSSSILDNSLLLSSSSSSLSQRSRAATAPAAPVASTPTSMTTPVLSDPATWAVSRAECVQYAALFRQLDTDNDGWLSGAEVRPTFLQSQLPNAELGAIWNLCDAQHIGRIDIRQFALGLWLCKARRGGASIPTQLPPRLIASLAVGGVEALQSTSTTTTTTTTASATKSLLD